MRQEATFKCGSIYYPNVTTLAVRCDGLPECYGEVDELDCNNDAFSYWFMFTIISALVIISIIPLKYLALFFIKTNITDMEIELI